VLTLRGGERVRLRALNTSNSGFVDLAYAGMRQIAGDQGLLPALAEPESLLLPPGDRFDLELLPGEADFEVQDLAYSHSGGVGWDEPGTLFTVQIEEPAPAAQPAAWPFSGAPASPPASQPDVVWVLTGDLGGPWLINGEQFPDITVPHLALGESMVIEVRNPGAGFAPDRLQRVFELFERGAAESAVPGVGVGLAICRAIVEAHGGSISAENPAGGGACVRFTLPRGTPPTMETESVAAAAQ
jgi:FtsP/CotA-like multicopper oxidase with cupredoxin domain